MKLSPSTLKSKVLLPSIVLCLLLIIALLYYRTSHSSPATTKNNHVLKQTVLEYTDSTVTNIDTGERLQVTEPRLTFVPSKELFVRAVYVDNRPRNGHTNSSVFLVVVKKTITDNNLIVGCEVDGVKAENFEVRLIGETPLWRHFYPKIDHEEAFVECYDVPASNGSTGVILYKTEQNSDILNAVSERAVFIPGSKVEPTTSEAVKYGFTIAACAKIFGHPPWLEEWLTYQKTLGVQHVHLDCEDSFKDIDKPFMTRHIQEGFLSVDIWKSYLNGNEIWYHNQGLIYEDCIYRHIGLYDYIILMDTDDFITPRRTDQKQLYFYIDKYCRDSDIGSCKMKWVEYFPEHFGLNKSISLADGNVTKSLNNYTHFVQGNPKSFHRTNVVIDAATHYAYKMMPGFRVQAINVNELYVAHVRLGNKLNPKLSLRYDVPHAVNGAFEHNLSLFICLFSLALHFIF